MANDLIDLMRGLDRARRTTTCTCTYTAKSVLLYPYREQRLGFGCEIYYEWGCLFECT
jgi:hypothetical protein